MTYKFRLCFRFCRDGTLTGKDKSVDFRSALGKNTLKLEAINKGNKLGDSSRFSLSGGPYKSVDQARMAAEAAKVALLYYATCNRVGIDIGKYASKGGLTKIGKRIFSEKCGVSILNDYLGITIFKAKPNPLFVRSETKVREGIPTQKLVNMVSKTFGRYRFKSTKVELATELFTMSYFEITSRARFLTLFMSLEILFEPFSRSGIARAHVKSLIETTKKANMPDLDKQSLLGGLAGLKNESIAQTGKKMAINLLKKKRYASCTPEKYFGKIYAIRNNLVHKGIVDQNKMSHILPEMDRFVSDIIQCFFIEF